jgi:hypothetical protein
MRGVGGGVQDRVQVGRRQAGKRTGRTETGMLRGQSSGKTCRTRGRAGQGTEKKRTQNSNENERQAGEGKRHDKGTGRTAGQLLKGDRQDSWTVMQGVQANGWTFLNGGEAGKMDSYERKGGQTNRTEPGRQDEAMNSEYGRSSIATLDF